MARITILPDMFTLALFGAVGLSTLFPIHGAAASAFELPTTVAIAVDIPNAIQAFVPGFEAVATSLMERRFKDNGVANLTELRQLCVDAGVHLVACQMTVSLLGFTADDFIPEVTEYAGAATFLPMARDADVSLFM